MLDFIATLKLKKKQNSGCPKRKNILKRNNENHTACLYKTIKNKKNLKKYITGDVSVLQYNLQRENTFFSVTARCNRAVFQFMSVSTVTLMVDKLIQNTNELINKLQRLSSSSEIT